MIAGLCGCFIRRTAGLVGVLVAVALVSAPVALANGDTITAQATVQFSGPVDNPASCNAECLGQFHTLLSQPCRRMSPSV